MSFIGQGIQLTAPRSPCLPGPSDLSATGANGSGSIALAPTAVIDAAGYLPQGGLVQHGSNGGLISLTASGAITAASGSSLDVAGSLAAAGGALVVDVGGVLSLGSTLTGAGGTGQTVRGRDPYGSLANFSTLNASLEAGGYTGERTIEARSGDLALAAGQQVTAAQVTLIADAGSIEVAGAIHAQADGQGGDIALYAGTGLEIASGATLDSSPSSAVARAGTITLSTLAGTLGIGGGAVLSAAGSDESGRVVLRAPAVGNDVAIGALPSDWSHVNAVTVEPIVGGLPVLPSAPTSADWTAIQGVVASYVTGAAPTILGRFSGTNATGVVVSPLVDLVSTGDVTLSSLDLSTWRFNGEPATLYLRAAPVAGGQAGNVTVNGVVSDGVTPTTTTSGPGLDLLPGRSTSITIVAGADRASASLDGTVVAATADLTLASGAIVRTGTGDLGLYAARDVVFASGASAYTLGTPGAASTPFDPATNVPVSPAISTYPDHGGNVSIVAGRDVAATAVQASIADWQPTFQSTASTGVAQWGVDPNTFDWSVGALGGGNVRVQAGRDATNLSAAVADSAAPNAAGTLVYYGGGDLLVTTGRDVLSGYFYVGRGTGTVLADGALGSARATQTGVPLGTLLLANDASFAISAQGNVLFQGEYAASYLNYDAAPTTTTVNYTRYSPTSALSLSSAGGGVSFSEVLGDLAIPFVGPPRRPAAPATCRRPSTWRPTAPTST